MLPYAFETSGIGLPLHLLPPVDLPSGVSEAPELRACYSYTYPVMAIVQTPLLLCSVGHTVLSATPSSSAFFFLTVFLFDRNNL